MDEIIVFRKLECSLLIPNKPRPIELKLRDLSQLFNSMDPSPFHEKDLDHDAEEFIASWAQEYPSKAPLELRIYLEQTPPEHMAPMIQGAIHNYFSYRKEMIFREFRLLMRQARTSLLIGLAFLGVCFAGGNVIVSNFPSGWSEILKEGLTIAGWVAMWRPIQLYLYDWWPVYRQVKLYERLSLMPIEINLSIPAEKTPS